MCFPSFFGISFHFARFSCEFWRFLHLCPLIPCSSMCFLFFWFLFLSFCYSLCHYQCLCSVLVVFWLFSFILVFSRHFKRVPCLFLAVHMSNFYVFSILGIYTSHFARSSSLLSTFFSMCFSIFASDHDGGLCFEPVAGGGVVVVVAAGGGAGAGGVGAVRGGNIKK